MFLFQELKSALSQADVQTKPIDAAIKAVEAKKGKATGVLKTFYEGYSSHLGKEKAAVAERWKLPAGDQKIALYDDYISLLEAKSAMYARNAELNEAAVAGNTANKQENVAISNMRRNKDFESAISKLEAATKSGTLSEDDKKAVESEKATVVESLNKYGLAVPAGLAKAEEKEEKKIEPASAEKKGANYFWVTVDTPKEKPKEGEEKPVTLKDLTNSFKTLYTEFNVSAAGQKRLIGAALDDAVHLGLITDPQRKDLVAGNKVQLDSGTTELVKFLVYGRVRDGPDKSVSTDAYDALFKQLYPNYSDGSSSRGKMADSVDVAALVKEFLGTASDSEGRKFNKANKVFVSGILKKNVFAESKMSGKITFGEAESGDSGKKQLTLGEITDKYKGQMAVYDLVHANENGAFSLQSGRLAAYFADADANTTGTQLSEAVWNSISADGKFDLAKFNAIVQEVSGVYESKDSFTKIKPVQDMAAMPGFDVERCKTVSHSQLFSSDANADAFKTAMKDKVAFDDTTIAQIMQLPDGQSGQAAIGGKAYLVERAGGKINVYLLEQGNYYSVDTAFAQAQALVGQNTDSKFYTFVPAKEKETALLEALLAYSDKKYPAGDSIVFKRNDEDGFQAERLKLLETLETAGWIKKSTESFKESDETAKIGDAKYYVQLTGKGLEIANQLKLDKDDLIEDLFHNSNKGKIKGTNQFIAGARVSLLGALGIFDSQNQVTSAAQQLGTDISSNESVISAAKTINRGEPVFTEPKYKQFLEGTARDIYYEANGLLKAAAAPKKQEPEKQAEKQESGKEKQAQKEEEQGGQADNKDKTEEQKKKIVWGASVEKEDESKRKSESIQAMEISKLAETFKDEDKLISLAGKVETAYEKLRTDQPADAPEKLPQLSTVQIKAETIKLMADESYINSLSLDTISYPEGKITENQLAGEIADKLSISDVKQ